MGRAVLMACVPWLALLVASLAVLWGLVRISRTRLELGRLRRLHADQRGAVQSLSFVLALPLFVMVLMLIVQISQLMIGQIVVEYAAYAAARAAVVWIPTRINQTETWNCVLGYRWDPNAANQPPSEFGPTDGGMTYRLVETSAPYTKYWRIRMAAVMACLPISPSRSMPGIPAPPEELLQSLRMAYAAMAPESVANPRIVDRLKNKLAYAFFQSASDSSQNTVIVEVRFHHSNWELPLLPNSSYGIYNNIWEFLPGQEIGWQDPITVKVTYKLVMLPGPGRLLARYGVFGPNAQQDALSRDQANANVYTDVYTYSLSASATLGNEGEKPAYAHYNLSAGIH